MKRLRYSCHTFAFGSPFLWVPAYPIEVALERIAQAGYDAVEVGATRPHAWPPDLDSKDRARLKKRAADLGLEICAITPCTHNLNVASMSDAERKDALDHYRDCIRLAADLGAKVVVYVPGWRLFGTTWDEAWARSVSAAAELAETAAAHDVVLAVEPINAWRVNIVNTAAQAVRMIEEIGSPHVQLMLDAAHVVLAGEDPADLVLEYGHRLVHVHCSDTNLGRYERGLPGSGVFPYQSFMRRLKEVGYDGYLSVEAWGPCPEDMAIQALQYLRSAEARCAVQPRQNLQG